MDKIWKLHGPKKTDGRESEELLPGSNSLLQNALITGSSSMLKNSINRLQKSPDHSAGEEGKMNVDSNANMAGVNHDASHH